MLQTKALKPSHREKKRYIVYEVSNSSNMFHTQQALVKRLEQLLGIFMSAQAGIMPLTFSNNRGILRVNHTAVDYIKACFTMIDELAEKPLQIKSILVSGVINKAKSQLK